MSTATVKAFSNLIESGSFTTGWRTEASFDLSVLADAQKDFLRKLHGIEIILPGSHGRDNENDFVFVEFESIFKSLLSEGLNVRLVVLESHRALKKAARKHKGLFYKNPLLKDNVLQSWEIDYEENKSLMAASVAVNTGVLSECIELLYDSDRCFLIIGNKQFGSDDFASLIKRAIVFNNDLTRINYAFLVANTCNQELDVWRVGGDGGDEEISIQIFTASQRVNEMVVELRQKISQEGEGSTPCDASL